MNNLINRTYQIISEIKEVCNAEKALREIDLNVIWLNRVRSMEEADESGAELAHVKVRYQHCPVEGCDYKTKSRNLGKHMKRRHREGV